MSHAKGFWSYVHKDDLAEKGRITQLAHDVTNEYEMITAETIRLFLDRDDISWGNAWSEVIDHGLEAAAFFVPIITPRYFLSSECRRELSTFARRAEALGVTKLIMPILYVDVPDLHANSVNDEVMDYIRKYQWKDWCQLRFAEVTSQEYRVAVANLARELADANRAIIDSEVASGLPGDKSPPPVDITSIPSDEPGLLDLLEQGERALPAAAATMEAINAVLENFTRITEQASEEINRSDKAGKGSAGRLAAARNLARNFAEPVTIFLDLANTFESQMVAADAAVKLMISSAPAAVDFDPAFKPALCEFFRTTRTTAQSTNAMLDQYEVLNDNLGQAESLSRDLRPILQQMRKGIATISAAASVIDGWVKAIDASTVNCNMIAAP